MPDANAVPDDANADCEGYVAVIGAEIDNPGSDLFCVKGYDWGIVDVWVWGKALDPMDDDKGGLDGGWKIGGGGWGCVCFVVFGTLLMLLYCDWDILTLSWLDWDVVDGLLVVVVCCCCGVGLNDKVLIWGNVLINGMVLTLLLTLLLVGVELLVTLGVEL